MLRMNDLMVYSEMFECVASVTESIPPEEFSLIYSAIYVCYLFDICSPV